MIYIDRDRKDARGRRIAPPREWFRAAEEAARDVLARYPNHVINDAIYRDDRVRAALEELFHRKCAYCEHPLPEVGWNVEHFRPKGRVAENRRHRGYYWLAYDWANLYPACVPCNQRRKDKPRWGDMRYGVTGGKADQFPLEDEGTRAMSEREDCRQKEKTLLIDPCYDEPSWYLTYDVTGKIRAIDDNPYGETTIGICHLNRRRLQDRRRVKVTDVVEFVQLIKDAKSGRGNTDSRKLEGWMNKRLLADSCPFAAVGRTVVSDPDRFFRSQDG